MSIKNGSSLNWHHYHFNSAKLLKLIKNTFYNAQQALSTATSPHIKSRHTIDKFNQVHRRFSWWDQNVSGIIAIYSVCLWRACWTQCAALIWSILPVEKCWLLIQLRDGPGGTNHVGPMVFISLLPNKWRSDRYGFLKHDTHIFRLRLQIRW